MNEAITSLFIVRINRHNRIFVYVFLLLCVSCSKQVLPTQEQMLFLGHIYQPGFDNRIDFRLEGVDFGRYDKILLGGDLCVETTKSFSTIGYLDSIFNISNTSTIWSAGNHDVRNGNIEFITTTTGRELTYFQDEGRTRFVVLNTNLTSNDCEQLEEQFSLLEVALDDLHQVDQLIIMSHHAIWTDYAVSMGETFVANARHSNWKAHCRDNIDTFSDAIAPRLRNIADDNTKVVWISGDFGQKRSAYEFMVSPNFYLLGSGLDVKKMNTTDSLLLINNHSKEGMNWRFIPIESLEKIR